MILLLSVGAEFSDIRYIGNLRRRMEAQRMMTVTVIEKVGCKAW
jgi:hypothetical protein